MFKKLNLAVLAVLAFGIGYSVNNIAISNPDLKVGVIDTAKIISNSSEVKTLKSEQQAKLKEIQDTLERARTEISKETDPNKAAQLEEKYRNEINKQKLALDTNYNNKVLEIDKKIRASISDKAKKLNYDLVLPKDIVFFGGDDLTSTIEKEVN